MSSKLSEQLSKELSAAKQSQATVRATWGDRELIGYGKLTTTPKGTRSRIATGELATMLAQRAERVGAQTPSGKIRSTTKAEDEAADTIDLILNNYVFPNANSQFPWLIKNRKWIHESYIYADMPMLAFWRVDDDYVGPDAMLLNPRSVWIQAGKNSTYDAQFVFVSTFVSKEWLEAKKKLKGWNSAAISRVLNMDKAKDGAQPAAKNDANTQSSLDASRNSSESGNTSEYELVTKYERGKKGRWVSFLPDYENEIIRDIENKLPSGRLPVVWKMTMPILTSPYGVGPTEQGESMQKATDSFVNLAHEAAKFDVFPVKTYRGGMVQRSAMKWEPNAFWKVTNHDDVQVQKLAGNNMDSFIKVYQFLKSANLYRFGSSDTMISATDGNPSFGKTPEALKQQDATQSTADRWDRDMYEQAYGELIELFIEMLIANNDVPIEFYVHDESVQKARSLDLTGESEDEKEDAKNMVRVVIPKSKLKGQFRFVVDMGSSMVKDDMEEHQRAAEIIGFVKEAGGPDALNQMLLQEGKRFNFAELLEKYFKSSGLKDAEEIVTDIPKEEMQAIQQQQMMMQQQAQMQAQQQQMAQQQMMQQPPMPQERAVAQSPQDQQYQPDPNTMAIVDQIRQAGGL